MPEISDANCRCCFELAAPSELRLGNPKTAVFLVGSLPEVFRDRTQSETELASHENHEWQPHLPSINGTMIPTAC
jgi:hypothetical protein